MTLNSISKEGDNEGWEKEDKIQHSMPEGGKKEAKIVWMGKRAFWHDTVSVFFFYSAPPSKRGV